MLDPLAVGLYSIAVLFALIFCGVYVAVALAVVGAAGVFLVTGNLSVAGRLLSASAYSNINDYIFAVIPLFVLMGALATASGATRDLFNACGELTRRIRGGLGVSVVFANAMFAAITGVSVASAAVFTRLALPEMRRNRYQDRFSFGIIAASSLLGMLLPPSLLMIVYGVLTEQSIGMLFAAGIGPGLLLVVTMAAFIWLRCRIDPALISAQGQGGEAAGGDGLPPVVGAGADADPPSDAATAAAAAPTRPGVDLRVIGRAWHAYVLMLVVILGIYGGFFTPTEAAAVAAFGALVLFVAKRGLALREMHEVVMQSGSMTGSILILLLAAGVYSKMLSLTGLPGAVTEAVMALDIGGMTIIAGFIVILLLLGMVLDSVSMMLVTVPIMFPVVQQLGYDPMWFGMLMIFTVEIGLLTPPFGMVLFTIMSSAPADVRYRELLWGVAPFIALLLLDLALLAAFPEITVYLPRLIFAG